jgi:hypothetical protein
MAKVYPEVMTMPTLAHQIQERQMVMAKGGRLHLNLKPQGVMKDRGQYTQNITSAHRLLAISMKVQKIICIFKDFKKDIIHLYFRHSD